MLLRSAVGIPRLLYRMPSAYSMQQTLRKSAEGSVENLQLTYGTRLGTTSESLVCGCIDPETKFYLYFLLSSICVVGNFRPQVWNLPQVTSCGDNKGSRYTCGTHFSFCFFFLEPPAWGGRTNPYIGSLLNDCSPFIGENRQLVMDEPVGVQDC